MNEHPSPRQRYPALPVMPGVKCSQPLRVCIASPEFVGLTRNGGIGTAYTALARALRAAGHKVTCLYLEGNIVASRDVRYWIQEYQREGIELVAMPAIKSPTLDAPRHAANSYEAYAWLKQHDQFDIIHFPEWRGPGYFTLAAKRQGLAFARSTLCIGTHSTTRWVKQANLECLTDLSELEKDFMERQSVELADVVVSPSQYLLEHIEGCGWKLPKACYVQQNVLPMTARRRVNSPLENSPAIEELVFFGRLETRKGVILFCDALDKLSAANSTSLRTVTFLGKEATIEGLPAHQYIQKRARKWAWKIQVLSNYDQPQAIEYLRKAGRLAVMPSLLENSPYTVLECLGAGVAFISARTGGIPELIATEDMSRVCFEPKANALAARFEVVLSHGCPAARAAVDPAENERAWVAWHESLPCNSPQPVVPAEPIQHPKVSVCLVTYNRPNLLRQALASIQALDYPNLEVVLVDDGSTTAEAIAILDELEPGFARREWKIVRQENKYLGAARNTAARHATGDFFLFMDDDNFAEPHEISTLVKVASRTGSDIVACGMNYFSGYEPPIAGSIPKGRWLPLGGAAAAGALRNVFGDANALVRRSCFEGVGGFTEDYGVTHEDWEFHAKAVLKGFALTVVPEFLFWYRVNQDSMIRTLARYHNYMRGIRPYVDAVPGPLRDLIYYAQGQHLLQTHTLGSRPSEAAEMAVSVAWRSKFEAARILAKQKQASHAVQLLLDAVKGVEASENPLLILEALMAVGQELAPLDRERARTLLELASQLAKALQKEEAQHLITGLLKALSGRGDAKGNSAVKEFNAQPPAVAKTENRAESRPATRTSVVIPVCNNLELTKTCLESIDRHTPAGTFDILVVDNGSDAATSGYLHQQEKGGRIRLLRNVQNQGFARACNQGGLAATSDWLLFLNNDTEVTPGWLGALRSAANQPRVGIVGAKLLYRDGTIQHAGIGFINGVPDHPYRHAPADAPEVNRFRELDMVTGACLLIHRELFIQLGGFDEAYRNGVEDVDLCLRARVAGRKVVYEPRSVVYHLEGQSAGRFRHVSENLKLFFDRWRKSFDSQYRLVTPEAPAIVHSSRSLLQENGSIAVTETIEVVWQGSFMDNGSLSHVNREMTKALSSHAQLSLHRVDSGRESAKDRPCPELEQLGAQLKRTPPGKAMITVRHAWPPDWQRPAAGKLVVIQPWEFGSLPESWVANSASVDEFWVPSSYVREVYVQSGVPAGKVKIVPNGIDPERFRPDSTPMTLATRKSFKFLFVGGTISRKGPDVLLEAYLRQFTAADDVCLVIKDFGGKTVYAGQTLEARIQTAQAQPNAPEILYLNEELTPDALPGLYTACNCLVHPYRGEGFGLPVLEAMACGLPVIVTAGGATDDFAPEGLALHIGATKRVFGETVGGMKLAGQGWLLEPSLDDVGTRMKWVVQHRDEAQTIGARASETVRRDWTWGCAAQTAVKRLAELQSRGGTKNDTSHARSQAATKAKAITLPPCARLGHLAQAGQWLAQHNARQAWEATVAALSIRPFHPEAYLLLGEIAASAGFGEGARKCAQHARAIAPGWKPARQFLNRRLKGSSQPQWLVLPPSLDTQTRRLSVCLITRNEEAFLARCLSSIKGLADQIVVVDTGSTDRTVEIAKEHGAEIYHFSWCDDFSLARNAALEHATGDWILVLDADEELSAEGRDHIAKHLQEPAALAWRLPLLNIGRESEGHSFVPRLFRNAPGLFYVGRVHEQVFSSIEVRRAEWGLENRLGDAVLLHHGYTPEMVRGRNKIERNLHLLEQAVEELPGEPNLLMNLGLELARSGRESESLERYRQAYEALSAKPPAEVVPELRETLLSQFCARLAAIRQFGEIVRVLSSPLARLHHGLNASLHFALGLAYTELSKPQDAADQMEQCLVKRKQRTLSPVSRDVNTSAPYVCLAVCQARLGNMQAAMQTLRNGLQEFPEAETLRIEQAKLLLHQEQPVEALQILHEVVTANARSLAAWVLGGQIALSRPQFLEFARDWTHEAITQLPKDKMIRAQRAEALLLSQETGNAQILWHGLAEEDACPSWQAALIVCDVAEGAGFLQLSEPADVAAISRAFLEWYRKCLAFGGSQVILRLNASAAKIGAVLPDIGQILLGIHAKAKEPAAQECCVV